MVQKISYFKHMLIYLRLNTSFVMSEIRKVFSKFSGGGN